MNLKKIALSLAAASLFISMSVFAGTVYIANDLHPNDKHTTSDVRIFYRECLNGSCTGSEQEMIEDITHIDHGSQPVTIKDNYAMVLDQAMFLGKDSVPTMKVIEGMKFFANDAVHLYSFDDKSQSGTIEVVNEGTVGVEYKPQK